MFCCNTIKTQSALSEAENPSLLRAVLPFIALQGSISPSKSFIVEKLEMHFGKYLMHPGIYPQSI